MHLASAHGIGAARLIRFGHHSGHPPSGSWHGMAQQLNPLPPPLTSAPPPTLDATPPCAPSSRSSPNAALCCVHRPRPFCPAASATRAIFSSAATTHPRHHRLLSTSAARLFRLPPSRAARTISSARAPPPPLAADTFLASPPAPLLPPAARLPLSPVAAASASISAPRHTYTAASSPAVAAIVLHATPPPWRCSLWHWPHASIWCHTATFPSFAFMRLRHAPPPSWFCNAIHVGWEGLHHVGLATSLTHRRCAPPTRAG